MRKSSGFIPIVIWIELAIVLVPDSEKVIRMLKQQVTLRGMEVINLKISDIDF